MVLLTRLILKTLNRYHLLVVTLILIFRRVKRLLTVNGTVINLPLNPVELQHLFLRLHKILPADSPLELIPWEPVGNAIPVYWSGGSVPGVATPLLKLIFTSSTFDQGASLRNCRGSNAQLVDC